MTTFFALLMVLAISLVACDNTVVQPTTSALENEQAAEETAVYLPTVAAETSTTLTYPIVDTGQGTCYDDSGIMDCPAKSEAFYGQDAQFTGSTSSYTDNGDGTITDNVTSLVWQQSADTDGDGDIDTADKMSYEAAGTYCENLSYAGYDDWQLPTIKQLYSLIDFTGFGPSGYEGIDTSDLIPFIDTDTFDFAYGDTDAGERIIDSHFNATSITNEAGQTDYAAYWSNTTHANWTEQPGRAAAYINFGRAMGYMNGNWSDVHGAGAQRSDPKSGDPDDYPTGNGPQGDAIRIYNMVCLVRDGNVTETPKGDLIANSAVTIVGRADSRSSAQPAGQADPGDQPTDAGDQRGGPGEHQAPDLTAAAAQLGVTEEALMAALGDPGQGPPDFAAAAVALDITEAELMETLGIPEGGMPPGSQPPTNTP